MDLANFVCTDSGLCVMDRVDGLSHQELERLVGMPLID